MPPSTPDPIWILVGTQTGNADRVAEAVAGGIRAAGGEALVLDLYDVVPEDVAGAAHVVLCTSTWGDGELPDNADEFHRVLDAYRPDLTGVRYGVVGLGDRFYDQFCNGGRILDALFRDLGATAVLQRLEIDAGPTKVDLSEARAWGERFARRTVAAPYSPALRP